MDTDSFVIHKKKIEKWFDTSNYSKDDNTPYPIGWNKKVIGLFKDELGGNLIAY